MTESVAVQFKQQFPILPLPETILLPHTIMPLSVFEPRYKQLVDHALDGSGQIALATYIDDPSAPNLEPNPPIRKAVCLAQAIQHEKAGDGFHLMLYGLCRATIVSEESPTGDVLYRRATLHPLEKAKEELDDIYRTELLHMLFRPNLSRLENHGSILDWVNEPSLTDEALFELVGCTVFDDAELRYALLSEPSSEVRSKRVLSELANLDRMLTIVDKHVIEPKDNGITLN
tara:strand:+ start:8824 stop:9516 length:693 start_codon:yes stop_codon:yes gene_type:complete